ncbi:MAG TPA: emopamil-binding family protein [candidate division Zixibacteria bacterium]|nr:emopamil-binding family protein [candidate division Zixibacteria bacterium]
MRTAIPIKERDLPRKVIDIILLVFFFINIIFICYLFDIEQLIVSGEDHTVNWETFTYPIWPPKFIVNLNHFVGQFDKALLYRDPWWRATIWIDVVLFGPFYIAAIIAFIRGCNWIRIPSIMWATIMLTNVTIILITEFTDPKYAGGKPLPIIGANLLWILIPILIIIRMALYPQTFSGERFQFKKEETSD